MCYFVNQCRICMILSVIITLHRWMLIQQLSTNEAILTLMVWKFPNEVKTIVIKYWKIESTTVLDKWLFILIKSILEAIKMNILIFVSAQNYVFYVRTNNGNLLLILEKSIISHSKSSLFIPISWLLFWFGLLYSLVF